MVVGWLTKRFFIKGWKRVFGREPGGVDNISLVNTIPNEIERVYGISTNKDIWNKFIDGINRLPRPLFTFGLFYLFTLGMWAPGKLQEYFTVMAGAPEMFWVVALTIIGFWFGGKLIEKSSLNIDLQKWKIQMETLKRLKFNNRVEESTPKEVVESSSKTKDVVDEFNSLGPKGKS